MGKGRYFLLIWIRYACFSLIKRGKERKSSEVIGGYSEVIGELEADTSPCISKTIGL